MKFLELHERLRLEIWRRIDLGVLSASLLARQTGLAQAHVSNFLHRRRRLSLPALDRILLAQTLSVEEIAAVASSAFPPPERIHTGPMDRIPLVSHSAAMTAPLITSRAVQDFIQLPEGWLAAFPARRAVSRRTWDRFVAVRITAAQALPMDPVLRLGSLVVIDRHYNSLAAWKPPRPNIYGVRLGAHLLFRHVSFESSRLVLRPRALDYPVELIELSPQESPSDLLVGRVCLSVSEI